uniref:MYB36 n=1 Tax=Arundo donax TaxID=35708 RepID=A0A0A9AX89_ARUDO
MPLPPFASPLVSCFIASLAAAWRMNCCCL